MVAREKKWNVIYLPWAMALKRLSNCKIIRLQSLFKIERAEMIGNSKQNRMLSLFEMRVHDDTSKCIKHSNVGVTCFILV
jgi:hypothetical protein